MGTQGAGQETKAVTDDWQPLVENNLPLVKYILGKLSRRLPPVVDRDELYAAGSMGLLEAARKYDPSRNVPFHSYAIPRIWGAMLDELRRRDHLSAEMRGQVTRMEACRRELRGSGGVGPTLEDVAGKMGTSVERVARLMALAVVGQKYASVEAASYETCDDRLYVRRGGRASRGPYEEAEFQDHKEALAKCIGKLPEREMQVIALRYHEGLYLHEIGAVLKVSESRVCQIHAQALRRLRKALRGMGVALARERPGGSDG